MPVRSFELENLQAPELDTFSALLKSSGEREMSTTMALNRIMNGKRSCKSNRPKERAEFFDDFDHCVIKRTIHGLYSRKIAPTVSKLLAFRR
jgi:hypothetical protein